MRSRMLRTHQSASFSRRTRPALSIFYVGFRLLVLCRLILVVEPVTATSEFYHPVKDAVTYQYPGLDLRWTTCGRFSNRTMECARLDVPEDQFNLNASRNRVFSIPLARLLSKMPAAPTLIMNNGGPGESGIDFIFKSADHLSLLFPDILEGLSLLAFDPRGVNNSIPAASCYPDKKSRYTSINWVTDWSAFRQQPGTLQAQAQNYARACHQVTGEPGAFINTPQTAADLNSILEAIGQKKLIYYGWSYGTVLGQTYAQAYPDRVGRMVLDGIWDSSYYRSIPEQAKRLRSTDQAYSEFIKECFVAGSDCLLSTGFDSAAALEQNLTRTLITLQDKPIAVFINASVYGQLSFADVAENGIWSALYDPLSWPKLASLLRKFMIGDYVEPFLEWSVLSQGDIDASVEESNNFISFNDASLGSSQPHGEMSTKDLIRASIGFSEISVIAGNSYSHDVFVYNSWEYIQNHPFVPKPEVVTAEPILLLSTRTDPITPLKMAHAVNKVFNGSSLLVQNSTGHTTISKPSLCTIRKTWLYLYKNELPVAKSTCPSDNVYFHAKSKPTPLISQPVDVEDVSSLDQHDPHSNQIDVALKAYQVNTTPLTLRSKSRVHKL